MMIPDDCDHFEPLVYDFWNEGGWESEGWTVIGEEGKYALFRQYIVNNSVYIMVFVDLNKISEEIREIIWTGIFAPVKRFFAERNSSQPQNLFLVGVIPWKNLSETLI